MQMIDIVKMAIHNLRRRPFRTALNLFGIVLGIVIILMTTAGTAGVKQSLRSLLENSEFTRKVIALRSSQISESDLDESDWAIKEPMSESRRTRMEETRKQHALNEKRRRFGRFRNIDIETLRRFESIANTHDVVPLMRLRFEFSYREFNQVVIGEGVSPLEVGLPDRIVAGNMLGPNDLDGVLIHELLAYQMGFVTQSDLDSLIGAEITAKFHSKGQVNDFSLLLTAMAGGNSSQLMQHQAEFLTAMKTLVGDVDESSLTEDQKNLIRSIFRNVVEQDAKQFPEQERSVSRKFKIKGVYFSSKNTDIMRYLQRFTFKSAQPVLFHHKTATDMQVNIQNKKDFYSATLFVDGYGNLEQVEKDVAAIGFETSSARKMLAEIDERIDEISRVIYLVALLVLIITAIVISNTLIMSVMERKSASRTASSRAT